MLNKIITAYFLIHLIIYNLTFSASTQPPIIWSENRKLTWSDFKGKPDINSAGSASTACKIEIRPVNVLVDEKGNIKNYKSLKSVALFFPDLSWVKKKKPHLLLHEQLHFDIVELYSRKLNRKFTELKTRKITKFESYVNSYKKLWAKCRKTQQQYDTETDHGRLVEINKIWTDKITNELKKCKKN